ncbi:guanine nucleotide exchange factor for Rab-3A isoform X3 [Callorhinchus milii]|nr:guanine nucleotide exchange factor for Rab-3A isoform X3 [Callorhinchus milii]
MESLEGVSQVTGTAMTSQRKISDCELPVTGNTQTPGDMDSGTDSPPPGGSTQPSTGGTLIERKPVAMGSQCEGKVPLDVWPLPGSGPGSELEAAGAMSQEMLRNAYHLSRLRSSSLEIREKGSERLREELAKAQSELKLKDEECEKLSKVREQLEQELEELTASLFEEAHKMVREANTKQVVAEKQLREAQGKIDVLLAEVNALKTLVLTSTPSSPNRELHPQLQPVGRPVFRKGHGRHRSTSSALPPGPPTPLQPVSKESREMDAVLLEEFQSWREAPSLARGCPFLERIYREDITPCLSFSNPQLTEAVQAAVEMNTLSIEPLVSPSLQAATDLSVLSAAAPERANTASRWATQRITYHRRLQLLHLHPVHPARPGPSRSRADVLGGDEAEEGDGCGQTGPLHRGGLENLLSLSLPAPPTNTLPASLPT